MRTLGDTMDHKVFGGPTADRGQSGMIGFVIIVALVIVGALVVVFAGSSAVEDLQQERTDSEARFVMEEVDSQLTTIGNADQSATGTFSLGDLEGQESRVVRRGYLNVTVDKRNTCRTNVTLSSIRYESDDGDSVAYQAGGVFLASDNGSAVQTPPDLQFRNGSLDVTITNLTGEVANGRNEAFYNATSSERESARRSAKLISGECIRPDNVTIHVRSDFYRAWASHLRDELNTSRPGTKVRVYESNQTAYAYLDQNRLPRRTDDERNRVVNMSDPDYMDVVAVGDETNPYPPNTIRVSKGVSNDYTVYIEPLTQTRLYIGGITTVTGVTNVSGPPRDVVFVLDESGSMSFPTPGASDRNAAAVEATKIFVGTLNESKDRVGLVGYSDRRDRRWSCGYGYPPRPDWAPDESPAWAYDTNGRYLTAAYDAFNATVDETAARCNTWGGSGLAKANQVLHLKSNQTRNQVIVFLSDGVFNGPGDYFDAREYAWDRANASVDQGATVYAVGFGGRGVDNSTLNRTAQLGGGKYYFAANKSQLVEVFENISDQSETENEQLALTPTSTNVSTGNGGVFAPQIPGDTDDLASATQNGQRFVNINDPTAPVPFSYSFAVSDDEEVRFNASTYSCDEWRGTNRQVTNTSGNESESYQVLRCTDINQTDYTLSPENVTIYTDGDDIEDLIDDEEDSAWWRQSLTNAIENRSREEMYIDRSGSTPRLRAKSNLAIVVLDYPDGFNSTNKLALVYRIGRAESEARADDVVNVRVRNVDVDD